MLDFLLPSRIAKALDNINPKTIIEVRIRVGRPVQVLTNKFYYLKDNGLTTDGNNSLFCTFQEINDLVFKACNQSIFAHNDELKQGFLTLNNGMRLGIAGEIVSENGCVKTIKNFSSINIRFAKEIKNCSLNSLKFLCEDNKFLSSLIISPPNCGKTTFIRDLCYQLSTRKIENNILVVDERNEICASVNGVPTLDVGESVDAYSWCTKEFGVVNGIRTMSPDLIILDEISTKNDLEALNYAVASGVKIIATTHSQDFYTLKQKPLFKDFCFDCVFDRFIVLSKENGFGTVDSIYNNAGVCIFCGG